MSALGQKQTCAAHKWMSALETHSIGAGNSLHTNKLCHLLS